MKENQTKKNNIKELFWYGVSGVTTAAVNIGLYYFFSKIGLDYRLSNFIAIVSSKIYAFYTNKYLVFRTHCSSWQEAVHEFVKFILARSFTGIIDFVVVWLAVSVLGMDRMFSKYAVQILVIIINYVFGKEIVFKRRDKR